MGELYRLKNNFKTDLWVPFLICEVSTGDKISKRSGTVLKARGSD